MTKRFRTPRKIRTAVFLLAACLLLGAAAGCFATRVMKPNEPYAGDLPPAMQAVAGICPDFVEEFRKLPSIEDGLLVPEFQAAELLGRIFLAQPESSRSAFKRMDRIGNPEVRPFCTPLQAAYWMVAEGRGSEVAELLNDYSLVQLLERCWGLPPAHEIPSGKMETLTAGLRESRSAFQQIARLRDAGRDALAVRWLFHFFGDSPNSFDSGSWYYLAPRFERYQEWDFETRHRWADFVFVTRRLNAPELVDYYQQMCFLPIAPGLQSKRPEDAFFAKAGDGWDFSLFASFCLRQAGYEVQQVSIVKDAAGNKHWTTLYRDRGGWYLLDNAYRPDVIQGIQGPFETFAAALAIYF